QSQNLFCKPIVSITCKHCIPDDILIRHLLKIIPCFHQVFHLGIPSKHTSPSSNGPLRHHVK
ncbi:LOW QUALITY PROTEIN: hypothetical protein PanWU01x14_200560, partial [Parasponia andersonii]